MEDRKLINPSHPIAYLLFAWEWLACRAADMVILDTRAHADYFVSRFTIDSNKTFSIPVGAELDVFLKKPRPLKPTSNSENSLELLFYGQFIPLHGIETIIQAVRKLENESVKWVIIGKGQEESRIRELLERRPIENLSWIPWVQYQELVDWITNADLCLGIFGDSEKASRVIPNKVFQILALGKPLITRDSPAIREILSPDMPGVYLIPPVDSEALAEAIRKFRSERISLRDIELYSSVRHRIKPASVGKLLIELARDCIDSHPYQFCRQSERR